jgi:2-polyprenyl-3-methyl-5-hydroxy-6-metoxy-1,4-benzoquinol methylase
MLSLEAFQQSYDTDTSEVVIRGRRFRLFAPKRIDRFIGGDDGLYRFPLWAKVWEASLILADELAGMPVNPEKTFLEIGSGLGLVGVVAASFGHRVTMTEYDPHALAFAKANAQLNGRSDLRILPFDWNEPEMDGTFDFITGSEVIYHERDFQPLQEVFRRFLKPGGEVILCAEMRRTNMAFFSLMQESYAIKAWKKTLRSEERTISVILCRMTPKQ